MTSAICGKCNGTEFRVNAAKLPGTEFCWNLVHCAKCRTAVGVVDSYEVIRLARRVDALNSDVKALIGMVRQIAARIPHSDQGDRRPAA
jgi:hypothetical protein